MRRLKIAQVTTSAMALQFLLRDQLHALEDMGHEVVCICSPGRWVQELRDSGLRVETIAMQRRPSAMADLNALLELRRVFDRAGFDVVHTHTPKAGLLGPVAARMAGVPVVLHTVHGLMFHDAMSLPRQTLFWLPEKLTATCAHRLLCQSREDVECAIATGLCPPGRITWIGNGIDVRRFSRMSVDGSVRRELGLKPTDFVVGCVGRMVRGKGHQELFAAAELLVRRYPDLRILMIGPDEHEHAKAAPLARFKGLLRSGAVLIAGERMDMPRCYAAMDVLAHPSHREGIPRACLEAAAMQLPVIASDIRGCREVLVPGQTGLLVPVRNPSALAEAVECLLLDPVRRRRMGAAGRRFVVENFDCGMVIERVAAIYREIQDRIKGRAQVAAVT